LSISDTNDSSGRDCNLAIFSQLAQDFGSVPYINDQFDQNETASFDTHHTFAFVWIENFFTNGRNFIYYVIGKQHITGFLQGMYGSKSYNGPLAAIPVTLNDPSVMTSQGPGVRIDDYAEVSRRSAKMEEVKWLYLFNTAVLAWKKLRVHPRNVEFIRDMNGIAMRQERAQKVAEKAADKAAERAAQIARIPIWGSESGRCADEKLDVEGSDDEKNLAVQSTAQNIAHNHTQNTSQMPVLRGRRDSGMGHEMYQAGKKSAERRPEHCSDAHIGGQTRFGRGRRCRRRGFRRRDAPGSGISEKRFCTISAL
jgi:hypothetical protein